MPFSLGFIIFLLILYAPIFLLVIIFSGDFSILTKIVGSISCIAALICGIGLARLKESARKATIYLLSLGIVWGLVILIQGDEGGLAAIAGCTFLISYINKPEITELFKQKK